MTKTLIAIQSARDVLQTLVDDKQRYYDATETQRCGIEQSIEFLDIALIEERTKGAGQCTACAEDGC